MLSRGFRSQMLVQAICCSHAKMVCEQIKALVNSDIKVDWVGTGPRGRTDKENEAILGEFCPPKNPTTGIRPWTLDILVNVGMAGEGTDCVDVCEVVFLNAPDLNNSTLQVIGRAARPPKGIDPAPVGYINVDMACPMAKFIGNSVETCFDDIPIPATPGDGDGNGNGNGGDYPLPPDIIIKNTTELVDVRTDPHFAMAMKEAKANPVTMHMAESEIEVIVERVLREGLRRRDAQFNESAEIMALKRSVENGCRLKAFQVQGMMRKNGSRLQTIEYQDIVKRIKNKKNRELQSRPDDCSFDELKLHKEWLKNLEQQLKNGLPQWLA